VVSIQGDYGRAARLFGAGEALREAIGASVLFYLVDYDRAVAAARDALGEEALATAWAQGREMTLDQAVAYALDEPSAVEAKASSDRRPAGASLRIFALGPGRVERDEHDLAPSEWTYVKSRELLFYLLSHPSRTKEQIGLALWPDASNAQLRSSFHRTLHHLRRALGEGGWILFEDGPLLLRTARFLTGSTSRPSKRSWPRRDGARPARRSEPSAIWGGHRPLQGRLPGGAGSSERVGTGAPRRA
jgi:hypothetical protein